MKVISSVTINCSNSGEFAMVDVSLENGKTIRVRVWWNETVQDAVDRQLASN